MKMSKRKVLSIILVVLVVTATFLLFGFLNKDNYETVSVEQGDLVKAVEISGKVVPAQEVDLSFGARGTIQRIYVDVGDMVSAGDTIAVLDFGEIDNEIREAQANLESANSTLNSLVGREELTEINFKKDALIKTLNKAYTNTEVIVRNQIDTFFENPNNRFPKFSQTLGGYFSRQEIQDSRYEIGLLLANWKDEIQSSSISNVSFENGYQAVRYLEKVENFLSLISDKAYDFSPVGDVIQSQIDAYLSLVATGRTTISSLKVEINTALNDLRSVEADVPVQNASINNFQATVDRLQSKKDNYIISAPFSGVITASDFEIGKVAEAGQTIVSMISNLPLEIEVFIPEINIVGVDVGDTAKLQFDALGDVVADAVIVRVDPKSTVKDGVITYKTLIDLINPNEALKPGMSVDTIIEKEVVADQIIIPSYVVKTENEQKYVEVLEGDSIKKINIEIIDSDNKGKISVRGDLNKGDQIIIPK